jgi:hypothetical protein
MSKLLLILIYLFAFSCSNENKIIKKKEKIIPKRKVELYIPQNAEFVIKNNKLNKEIFNKDYSPSVIYEFYISDNRYFLSNQKRNIESFKLNHYYLTPKMYYHVGKFNYNLDDFDFCYHKNLFRIISLNDKEMTIFSTGNDKIIGEIPEEINIFKDKELDILVNEENPLFYDYFVSFIDFKYKFKSIKSYFLIKYSQKIKKMKFYEENTEESYILIINLKDFEEISQFKKLISVSNIHYTVSLKDIYSSTDKSLYIFFNGDKIIFAKNINSLELLDKINKIPLTKLNKLEKNNGYIIVTKKEYLENIFNIFKKIDFKGKITYYFFDYKKDTP